jgi:hypothetical protein
MTSRFYFDFIATPLNNYYIRDPYADTVYLEWISHRLNKLRCGGWERSFSIFLLITRDSFYFSRLRGGGP